MSFSISISGHVGDDEKAAALDAELREHCRAVVAAAKEAGATGLYASFNGPSGSVDLVSEAEAATGDTS